MKKKQQYFANLNDKDITDNRKCWHTVKQFFSEKNKSQKSIVLTEKDKTMSKKMKWLIF